MKSIESGHEFLSAIKLTGAWNAPVTIKGSLLTVLGVLLVTYAFFPSESSAERFALAVRTGAFGLMTAVAVIFGSASKRLLSYIPWVIFLFVFAVVLANVPSFPPRVVNLVGTIVLAALVVTFIADAEGERFFRDVISLLLFLSAAAVFFQVIYYFISGDIVDIHQFFFPWGGSRSGELEKFGIARLSGMHTEPGTHSVYTFGLIVLRVFLGGRLFDRVSWISVVSIALTLSAWGVGVVFLYFLSYLFYAVRVGKWLRELIGGFCLVVFCLVLFFMFAPQYLADNIFEYFQFRSQLSDGSGNSKIIAWHMGLVRLNEVAFVGIPVVLDYCDGCLSPQDAGLILNFSLYFGLFSGFVFFGVYLFGVFRAGGVAFALFGLPFLFSKFFYFDPIVWVVFFAAFFSIFKTAAKFSASSVSSA